MHSEAFGPGIRLWAGTELRRRSISLVVLGVLGGLAAGLAIAAYDGAQRSGTAYTRMRDELHAADVVAFPSLVEIGDFDLDQLDQLPEVESWGGFALNSSAIDGFEQYGSPFITVGDDWFSRIEGAVVVEGRLPDPDAEDEAVISEVAADDTIGLGSVLTWRNLSLEQAQQFPFGAPPDFDWTQAEGPVTKLRIVGVVRNPIESVAAFASGGTLFTNPVWMERHGDEVALWFTNAVVRLRNGSDDLPAFRASIDRLTGRTDVPIKDLQTDIKRVQRSLDIERTALLMFSAAIAITALVLVGQAIVRATASGASSVPAMRAMGASNVSLALGLAVPMLVTIAATMAVAAVTAIVATRWFPVGLARKVDPDGGIHADLSTLSGGLALTGLAIVVVVAGSAIVVQRQARQRGPRRSTLMSWAMRAGATVPSALGTSLALDAGPTRAPRSRLAVAASVAGVVAVIGALTLVYAIDDLVDHPERTGATWDLVINGEGVEIDELVDAADDPAIAAMAISGHRSLQVDGTEIPIYGLDVRKGTMAYTIVDGTEPIDDDEVALGPASMRLLDVSIGDTVRVGAAGRPMRVVGEALLAQQPHTSFDEGGWVSTAAYTALVPPKEEPDDIWDEAYLTAADGATADEVARALPPDWQVAPPSDSADVSNLVQVRSLPIYLAAFLAVLALGAVAHALFTGVRERGRELAVLRALGVTPRQAATSVTWQALVTAAIALAAGIPVGVIVGQRVWRLISDELSFVYVGPVATALLVAAVPVCLGACLLLAMAPARGTARRRITDVLREE